MKKTIKKVLCTALAAVSLSAIVTVPSSLNAYYSNNSIINVMEAKAAQEKVLYQAYMTKGKNYYIRKTKNNDTTSNIKWIAYPYYKFNVYEEDGNWVRISPKGKEKEWVWRNRAKKLSSFSPHNCNNKENQDVVEKEAYWKRNKAHGFYEIQYQHKHCFVCGNEVSPRIISIHFIPKNGNQQWFYSLSQCPDVIKPSELYAHLLAY